VQADREVFEVKGACRIAATLEISSRDK
jgi:hypothetical protein